MTKIGGVYNYAQEAIRFIPIVGKPLEKLVPDAYQTVWVLYRVEVDDDMTMAYDIQLNTDSSKTALLRFNENSLL